nr:7-ethoxycoumarin o-deethylase [Quercus suber]
MEFAYYHVLYGPFSFASTLLVSFSVFCAQRETDKTTRHGDFLDVLLDQMQEDGSDFSIDTIKPLILDLFIAGSDTSGLTTEWAMAELLLFCAQRFDSFVQRSD